MTSTSRTARRSRHDSRRPENGCSSFSAATIGSCANCATMAPYGIEAQFWKNEEFLFGRRFDPALDATRTSRDLAVQWAMEERKAIEASSDRIDSTFSVELPRRPILWTKDAF
jgi:hypothetical protein